MKENLSQASVEPLLNYFDRLIPLTAEEKELVTEKFHPRLFRKRQYILQEGDVCTQFYFVVRGCWPFVFIGRNCLKPLIFRLIKISSRHLAWNTFAT